MEVGAGPEMTTPEQPGMAYVRGIDSAELAQETVGQALVRASRDAANGAALVWLTDAEWVIAASLPRTSTGKVRKHLLREWHQDGTLHARCGVAGPAPGGERH
jgi:acyl-CoA synthetase (AMP-forming)/AMP-acid ligase II